MSAPFEGTLRVGAPSTFATAHLASPTATFAERRPSLRIELVLSGGPSLAPRDGRVDIHLRIDPPTALREQDEEHRVLAPDRLVLCAAPSALRRRGIPWGPQDLARHDVIARRGGPPVRFRGGPSLGLAPTARVIADEDGFVREAALSGLGIAALPASLVAEPLDDGRLVEVLGDALVSDLAVVAVTAKDPDPLVTVFLDHLAAEWTHPPWSAALDAEDVPSDRAEGAGARVARPVAVGAALCRRDAKRLAHVAALYAALDPDAASAFGALLARARIVDDDTVENVAVGTRVRIRDAHGAVHEHLLVFPWDGDEGLSILSPLGQALLGLPIGAPLVVPGGCGGPRSYVVEAIVAPSRG